MQASAKKIAVFAQFDYVFTYFSCNILEFYIENNVLAKSFTTCYVVIYYISEVIL